MNKFSLGVQVGGRTSQEAGAQEQQLRNLFTSWTGDYSSDIREFAFLLRIDGQFHTYTKEWNICGAQPAKRKRDWVEIGVSESWWRAHSETYKHRLANEIKKGFLPMIDLLRRNGRDIKAEALIHDWKQIKSKYLAPSVTVQ